MNLDPLTMVVVIITSTLLLGGGLAAVSRRYLGAVKGADRWAVATLLQAVGWFIIGPLRASVPEAVTAVAGPFLVQAALTMCLFVLHDFEETPVQRRWFYALLAAYLGGAVWFTAVTPSVAGRQVLLGATAGVITLRSAWVLFSGKDRLVPSHMFMAIVFATCGLVMAGRGFVFLVADPTSISPVEPNAMSSASLMVFYAFAVVLPFGFVLMCNDRYISQRREAEDALSAAALVDSLTQLPNRAMVTSRLVELSSRATDDADALYAVLFIDINNFKYVNDSLGHHAGDQLLVETGQRLMRVVRARDTVARRSESLAGRFGGDEFVLILDSLHSPDEAAGVAERILGAMASPFTLAGQRVSIQCSIGISVSRRADRPLATEDLLREADTAMYRAKSTGRANFVVFDESMHVEARRRLMLESDLRVALETGQIRAHYQPIIDLTTGSIVAFEALARWEHPEHGMIPPDAFIPIADETGLIFEIGRMMMEQAVEAMERMNRLPGGESICMNVNVSRRELAHPRFLARVKDVASRLTVEPRRLRLEITETAVSGAATAPVSSLLLDLKALGVEILLDDFGAGLSSLSLLRSLPLDGIKIDRSFLERSNGDVQAITILNAIIALGHNLGKTITVEGVAEPQQVATVLALDGDLAQGYLFGRPMPPEAAEALLGKDFSSSCVAAA